jgi:hypothetical protein
MATDTSRSWETHVRRSLIAGEERQNIAHDPFPQPRLLIHDWTQKLGAGENITQIDEEFCFEGVAQALQSGNA